jgi:ribonuclease VapC
VSSFVLDASALLALLNEEPGNEIVEDAIGDCSINAVNYCEVIGKLMDAGVPEDDARHTVDLLNIEIVDLDANLAFQAALLRPATRRFGLSLGDRCCLALGMARKATVLTSERSWWKLKIGAKVKLIR